MVKTVLAVNDKAESLLSVNGPGETLLVLNRAGGTLLASEAGETLAIAENDARETLLSPKKVCSQTIVPDCRRRR